MKAALLLILALAEPALALGPAEALARREEGMKAMENAMRALGAVRLGVLPHSPGLVRRAAGALIEEAEAMRGQFPPGSEGGKAAPSIWAERARFEAMTDDLAAAALALRDAAEGEATSLEAAERAAATCTACHERYRRR